MDPSFGARLRSERERQQIALSTIAAETKIKRSLLEALERDDVSRWPEGIFRRAYVRAYARAIGLDPEAVVREFLERYPDAGDVVSSGLEALQENGRDSAKAPSSARFRRLVTSVVPGFGRRAQAWDSHVASLAPAAPDDETAFNEPVRVLPLPAAAARKDAADKAPVRAAPHLRTDAHEDAMGEPVQPEADTAGAPGENAIGGEQARAGATRPMCGDDPIAAEETPHPQPPTLSAAAQVAVGLGRVRDRRDLAPVLEEAARIAGAVGLIVWSWDARAGALIPSLAHGYADAVLARLPAVPRDAANAVAAAFRSADACVVPGADGVTGAIAVPLIGPEGCVGVLALEFRHGREHCEAVRAFATILASQLARVLESAPLAGAVNG